MDIHLTNADNTHSCHKRCRSLIAFSFLAGLRALSEWIRHRIVVLIAFVEVRVVCDHALVEDFSRIHPLLSTVLEYRT